MNVLLPLHGLTNLSFFSNSVLPPLLWSQSPISTCSPTRSNEMKNKAQNFAGLSVGRKTMSQFALSLFQPCKGEGGKVVPRSCNFSGESEWERNSVSFSSNELQSHTYLSLAQFPLASCRSGGSSAGLK